MPIIALQRRLVPVGRIRMGEKKTARSGKTYPAKLSTWRLTSADKPRLAAVAEVYGGTVRKWEEQWEVYTTTNALDIVVIPGQAVSQHMELWGQRPDKGDDKPRPVMCLRRCDGQQELLTDKPCICATEPGDDTACKPVTHLMVMLPKVPGIGMWRVTTRGNNAAAELLGTAEVLEQLTAAGEFVPARLRMDQRTSVNQDTGVTNHFVVPVIDIDIALNDVFAGHALGMGGSARAIAAAPPSALEPGVVVNGGPRFTPISTPAIEAESRSMADQFGEFDQQSEMKAQTRAGRTNASAALPTTGVRPKPRSEVEPMIVTAASPTNDPDDGGPADEKGAPSGGSSTVQGSSSPSRTSGVGNGSADRPAQAASSSAPVNRVAIVCREAGLDDSGRHDLCAWASRGRVQSSKLLTEAETTLAIDGAHKIKAGTHLLDRRDDGSLGLKDQRFGFSEDPPTGSSNPVTVDTMPTLTADQIAGMKGPQLVEACRDRGLQVGGKVEEMRERLMDALGVGGEAM